LHIGVYAHKLSGGYRNSFSVGEIGGVVIKSYGDILKRSTIFESYIVTERIYGLYHILSALLYADKIASKP